MNPKKTNLNVNKSRIIVDKKHTQREIFSQLIVYSLSTAWVITFSEIAIMLLIFFSYQNNQNMVSFYFTYITYRGLHYLIDPPHHSSLVLPLRSHYDYSTYLSRDFKHYREKKQKEKKLTWLTYKAKKKRATIRIPSTSLMA